MSDEIIKLKFNEKGLIPTVIQDAGTKKVLMLAYMNNESYNKTLETGTTWFYSRSRNTLWNKGETSGNYQFVKGISLDCDGDTLLVEVLPKGPACHTGSETCFNDELYMQEDLKASKEDILLRLYNRIQNRKENPVEGSYTNYLFDKGIDKILKKVGEETSEVIIGAKNDSKGEIIYEVSDLVYHLMVLLVEKNISIDDIKEELLIRYK
jgi:phosphoribosyl-ATP pyrophosphohydrolase/phosphoribosyl-AMP cyclohydrolase